MPYTVDAVFLVCEKVRYEGRKTTFFFTGCRFMSSVTSTRHQKVLDFLEKTFSRLSA